MLRTRQSRKRLGTVTSGNAAATAPPEDVFTDTPQFGSGNPGRSGNRTRHVKAVVAQQHLDDEDWRATHFGNWLEGLPEPSSNIAQQLAPPGHDAQDDTELRRPRPNNGHDKHENSASKVDNDSVYPPNTGYPVSDPLPTITRPEFDINPRDEFESWAAQKKDEFRRKPDAGAYDGL